LVLPESTYDGGPTAATDPTVVRVAIVVSVPLLRDGVTLVLQDAAGIDVVATAASFAELLDADVDALGAVVAYIDGIEDLATPSFLRVSEVPGLRMVGLHDNLAARAIEMARTGGFEVLVDIGAGHSAIIDAVMGARARTLRRWEPPRVGLAPLTERERAVLARVAEGDSSRDIAKTMLISVHTVENYKQRAFRKLGVANQAQAVATALRHGLLGPTPRRSW
jgi:DNA-binding NarL/FixJ family response regulator